MEIQGTRTRKNPQFNRVYQTWYNMMQRCYNPKNPYYKNYGGKGVCVCERWRTFDNFLEDFDKIKGFCQKVFEKKGMYLDKDGAQLENNEYNLHNCQFVDISESNKRKQHQMRAFVVYDTENGREYSFFNQSECARKLGIGQTRVSEALRKSGKYKNYRFRYTENNHVTTIPQGSTPPIGTAVEVPGSF